jgi:hypothetical protein
MDIFLMLFPDIVRRKHFRTKFTVPAEALEIFLFDGGWIWFGAF